jgi:hypothetical protein
MLGDDANATCIADDTLEAGVKTGKSAATIGPTRVGSPLEGR